jgi:MFS family permease
MATAAVTNFQGMLITRILLGMAESTVSPSLMLITAQWYTKSEQAPRFAFWVELFHFTSAGMKLAKVH